MLSSNNKILLTLQKSQFKIHDPKSGISQTVQIESVKENEDLGFVLAGSVSDCNNYICVSDDLKRLYLYKITDSEWKLLRQSSLDRRCSYIKFSFDSEFIIVADKSGYILRIPVEFENFQINSKEEDKLRWVVMGHVSVLIDFDLHPSQKLIATADRDEKIRISFYPNSYEIYTYLLGHTKFVSQIKFSSDGRKLFSSGADGYVIIWDLKTKQELYKHKYSNKEENVIPIVTRLFVVNDKIFLFFKNEKFVQIITLVESVDGIRTNSVEVDISCQVLDVAAVINNQDSLDFYVINGSEQIQIDCFTFDGDCSLLKKENDWLLNEDFNDSPIFARNKFLETLPKVPLDKTGLQVYYEQKEKRMKLNGHSKSIETDEDDD